MARETMTELTVAIHQPNFLPWLGYFQKIAKSDVFIFLDDVQFPRGNRGCVVNRVEVACHDKRKWLTLPIERKESHLLIRDIPIVSNGINEILEKIENWYRNYPYLDETIELLKDIFNSKSNNLSQNNMASIKKISTILGFKCSFLASSDLKIKSHKQNRIIDLVKEVNGTRYISGIGARKYQDAEDFKKNGIDLCYNEASISPYSQFNTSTHLEGLSIIDAFLNCGFNKTRQIIFDGIL